MTIPTLGAYVGDPTSPAYFHAGGPLGAGRVQIVAANANLVQWRNACRNLVSHPGNGTVGITVGQAVAGISASDPASMSWDVRPKDGGCAFNLGTFVVPSAFPGSFTLPGLVVTFRAKVAATHTAHFAAYVTPVDTTPLVSVIGSAAVTVTSSTMATYKAPIFTTAGDPSAWSGAAPLTLGTGDVLNGTTPTETGPAYLFNLWFAGWVTTGGPASCSAITAFLVAPGESW